jgi:hypothetical protein
MAMNPANLPCGPANSFAKGPKDARYSRTSWSTRSYRRCSSTAGSSGITASR